MQVYVCRCRYVAKHACLVLFGNVSQKDVLMLVLCSLYPEPSIVHTAVQHDSTHNGSFAVACPPAQARERPSGVAVGPAALPVAAHTHPGLSSTTNRLEIGTTFPCSVTLPLHKQEWVAHHAHLGSIP
eukprot:EG_transcript_23006